MESKQDTINDGDVLPVIGGPADGTTHKVEWLFPFIESPAMILQFDEHYYELDRQKRAYIYRGVMNHGE